MPRAEDPSASRPSDSCHRLPPGPEDLSWEARELRVRLFSSGQLVALRNAPDADTSLVSGYRGLQGCVAQPTGTRDHDFRETGSAGSSHAYALFARISGAAGNGLLDSQHDLAELLGILHAPMSLGSLGQGENPVDHRPDLMLSGQGEQGLEFVPGPHG